MNTLDKYEADAKDRIAFLANPYEVSSRGIRTMHPKEVDERILALCDLIRRKDEALLHIGSKGSWINGCCITEDIRFQAFSVEEIADDALALTEQLGRGEAQ